jgi:hypothetical protein
LKTDSGFCSMKEKVNPDQPTGNYETRTVAITS